MKKISVVMTTYNGQKYLFEQLESVRNQTRKIDEVIILDDCSQDKTTEVIKNFIIKNNLIDWQLIENQTNQGWKKNFKVGFDLATGDYIFPCDQDDIWHPDKVQKMVDCMEKHPEIELLAANYEVFFSEKDDGHGSKLYKKNSRAMKSDGSINILEIDTKWAYINRPGCVYCFTKAFYESICDKWNTDFPHDAILWRFARMNHALAILNYSVIDFRRHGNNATSDEFRNKDSRIQTFNDYIYFHKIALERVTSKKDKMIIKKGIDFLEKRKYFYETRNIFIWIELLIMYHNFYNSPRGCLGDLYFVYRNVREK